MAISHGQSLHCSFMGNSLLSLGEAIKTMNPTARHEITEILLKMALDIYIKLLNETKSNGVMNLFSKVMKRLYLYYIKLNDHSIELLYFYYHESPAASH
jgi:hypothetical protein